MSFNKLGPSTQYVNNLLTVLFHVQHCLTFVPLDFLKSHSILRYVCFGKFLVTAKWMCEPPLSRWACSPNNHRLGTAPNKKIFPGPLTARWELGARQSAITHQVYKLTRVRGNVAGLETPFFITRLKYSNNWWSLGLEGSTRTCDVEGS
jgi:hypothetical protein